MKQRFFAVIGLAVFMSVSWAAELPPWPQAEKQAAIAGCRLSITTNAERDYLKRHNLKELPPDFRNKTAAAMEPFLASCNCMFEQLEKHWTFEYFMANQGKFPAKVNELMSGPCAPKPAARPRAAADATALRG
jgi:hypothetical protein